MKLFIRIVMGLVALAAGALSFQSLMHLGELCGYGGLAWAYPVTLDLGAAASCASWIHERNRQALGMTWAMLAISVVLNGTLHYLQAASTSPSWVLVVLVAAVPPAVFGLVVHLAVGVRPAAVRDDVTAAADPLVEKAREALAEDPSIGRGALARRIGVSEWRARKALDQLASTNGHAK